VGWAIRVSLDAVFVVYWSLKDPLCQSQCLPAVRDQVRRGRRMGLITYENEAWALAPQERAAEERLLAEQGIRWMPLRYHKRPRLLATLYDVARGVARCVSLARRDGVRLLHARATVPGAVGYWASRIGHTRFFNDADGPLSDEYADAGLWRRGSIGHRLARWSEETCLAAADAVAVLSRLRQREVEARTRHGAAVLPCGVDTDRFSRDVDAGRRLRAELGLEGTVLAYAGKSGGWYLTEPMLDFARAAGEALGPLTLLVLTTGPAEPFTGPAAARGVRCVVRRATTEQVPALMSAADAGLSFRLIAPSQRASSPIKNGEYLSCGLPVVTTPGAGDYSDLVERRRVGVVVEGLDLEAYRRAARSLATLLGEPGIRERCRQAAIEEVSLREVVLPRYAMIYDGLLGVAEGGRA
jgi:glycosyltransferase involved in cell wall biosynthesis